MFTRVLCITGLAPTHSSAGAPSSPLGCLTTDSPLPPLALTSPLPQSTPDLAIFRSLTHGVLRTHQGSASSLFLGSPCLSSPPPHIFTPEVIWVCPASLNTSSSATVNTGSSQGTWAHFPHPLFCLGLISYSSPIQVSRIPACLVYTNPLTLGPTDPLCPGFGLKNIWVVTDL